MLLLVVTFCGCGGEPDAWLTLASRTLASVSSSAAISTPASAQASSAKDGGMDSAAGTDAPAESAPDAAAAALDKNARCCHGGRDVYGIVNLVPFQAFGADINGRGQAAFEYVGFDQVLHVGFFDGDRVLDPLPQATTLSVFGGLNDRGDLALMVRYLDPSPPYSNAFQAVRWSAARGAVFLPSTATDRNTYASAINSHGDIAGATPAATGDDKYQGARWTPANRLLSLPLPTGFDDASALDINDSDLSTGYGFAAGSDVAQAILWDAAGRPTDLGTFGTGGAVPHAINKRGEIAGMLNPASATDYQAFLWRPGGGATPLGARTVFHQMNDAGEVVGRIQNPDNDNRAYYYSRARGLVNLHPSPFFASEANDLDERGVIVGLVRSEAGAPGRAWRWSRAGASADLNTRLLDPPSGLVVTNAFALAANGDIVANSNAGVVVLRHGGGGTDAPVLGPIQLPQLHLNEPVRLTLSFRDRNPGDSHTATVDWGDGRGPQPATVREYRGRGVVQANNTYTAEGDYTIVVRVTDATGNTTMQVEQRLLLELGTPALLGEGVLPQDGAGVTPAQAPLMFRLAAPLAGANPSNTPFAFRLSGRTTFEGERLDRVIREGKLLRLEGTGRLNGRSGQRFLIEASVGATPAEPGRIRVRITDAAAPRGTQRVLFDSSAGAASAPQALGASGVLRRGSLRLVP